MPVPRQTAAPSIRQDLIPDGDSRRPWSLLRSHLLLTVDEIEAFEQRAPFRRFSLNIVFGGLG